MENNLNPFFLLLLSLCITNCTADKKTESKMQVKTIMEVTTFSIKSNADPSAFAQRDAAVESNFTRKQPGFLKRQSGLDDKGNYAVVVYWKSVADADASMNKFMNDASVADYAEMIDGPTMTMSRYVMDKPFHAANSRFVEIMSFEVKPGMDMAGFDALNQKVETDFTGKRKGFLQRLTGINESGTQVVAVYWADKASSDAALQPFMNAPIAKEFMQQMAPSSIAMGRYEFLKTKK